jgi:hypothetical protein
MRRGGRRPWSPRPADRQPHRINAVVGRQWRGQDAGPGGQPVFLTHASVAKPLPPVDAEDERRLIEPCGLKAAKHPWARGHPPLQHARAVQVHVLFTRLLFALATASRLACACEARGAERVGWPRWRRHLLAQTRDPGLVCTHGDDGIFPLAEDARLLGVQRNDVPPAIGSRHQVLAKYRLSARDEPLYGNFRTLD